jgi:hypothetical protein
MYHVKVTGEKEVERKIRAILKKIPKKLASAMYKAAEKIMTISKRDYCPVDLGVLKGTGHVDQPVISGDNISVQLSYGGPAAPYAAEQHENLDYSHTVGEAKYLEKPLMAAANTLARDLAKDVKL